jgi:hypothetical protein
MTAICSRCKDDKAQPVTTHQEFRYQGDPDHWPN